MKSIVQLYLVVVLSLFIIKNTVAEIKALAIPSKMNGLYIISNNNTSHSNSLYTINTQTNDLTKIADIGFAEIDSLTFRPDGTLWGWVKGKGLIEIDAQTGESGLVIPSSASVTGIAWNHDGTHLYGALNDSLWGYDGQNVKKMCDLSGYTHSLEILSKDTLLINLYGQNTLLAFDAIYWETCEIVLKGLVLPKKYDNECTTQRNVIPKLTISLDQSSSTMTITEGTNRYFAVAVNLSKSGRAVSRVIFSQTIVPDVSGIHIFSDYPTNGWSSALSKTFIVNESISGLKSGTYTITSTATITDTGESHSKKLTVKVIEPEPKNKFFIISPGTIPEGINLNVPTDVIFTSSIRGTDNPPPSLTLEEVDENGLPIKTLGVLKNDGMAGDLVAGDFTYSRTFTITESVEGKKFYRTSTIFNGEKVISDTDFLVVTRFPIKRIVPYNPENVVVDPITGIKLYSDELLVNFVEGVSPDRIEEIVAAEDATIIDTIPGQGVFILRIPSNGTAQLVRTTIETFQAYPEVKNVDPSILFDVD